MDKVMMYHGYEYVAQVYDEELWYAEDSKGIYTTDDIEEASPHKTMQDLALLMQEYDIEQYHIIEIEEIKTRRVVI